MLGLFNSRFLRTFVCCALVLLIPASYFFFVPAPAPSPDDAALADDGGWGGWSYPGSSSPLKGADLSPEVKEPLAVGLSGVPANVLSGGAIMGHLGNETAKAELGRASWKLLHLITLRFPDTPSPSEREALKSYFHLFARLYPCGECAAHFMTLLEEYPVQTSSRKSASLWLCHLHNQINTRLLKPQFDCTMLDATYDCGCGPEPDGAKAPSTAADGVSDGIVDGKDGITGVAVIKGGR